MIAQMTISLYAPEKLYGFCRTDSGEDVFFHLGVFVGTPPPPILGEVVEVDYEPVLPTRGSRPRALRVRRLTHPVRVSGVVTRFDTSAGWGFARGEDGVDYHLHRSEVQAGRLPVTGASVSFFAGTRNGRPRACHVEVL